MEVATLPTANDGLVVGADDCADDGLEVMGADDSAKERRNQRSPRNVGTSDLMWAQS